MSNAAAGPGAELAPKPEAWRWAALALVFFAALLNYADRQVLSLLKPTLEQEFGWDNRDYAHITSGFQLATMFSLLAVGWFVDRVGLRWGYAWGVGIWSLAGMAHAAMTTVSQFVGVRVVLGVSEAVNLPAAVKTVATWFPGPGRSLALGIMNTAPNMGAVVAPLIVPPIALAFGWKMAFVALGAAGGIWLAFWFLLPRAPGESGPAPVKPPASAATAVPLEDGIGVVRLLRSRYAWTIGIGKFLTDFVWVFLLFWGPDFFNKHFGLTPAGYAGPLALVYGLAAVGALFGGTLSAALLQSGRSYNVARKVPMMVSAVLALGAPAAMYAGGPWAAAAILGLTLLAHQIFSTNMFGLATDLFPPRLVGRVMGLGGTLGSFSGFLMGELTGEVRDRGWSFEPMLWICGFAYVVALVVVHLMTPNIDQARALRQGGAA